MTNETANNGRGQGELLKGLVAGLIGGLVASWTMNRFQDLWFGLVQSNSGSVGTPSEGHANEEQTTNPEEADDTTVKAALAISEGIFNHKLTREGKKIAGTAVHYSLGTGVGGLYGAVAEAVPEVTRGAGLPFGLAFWLIVDETAVPLLRFSKGPTQYPLSTHVYALTSHLVYGLTAEVVRRGVRNAL